MTSITLPPLQKARGYSAEERLRILAQIADYSRQLASTSTPARNSEETSDNLWKHPRIRHKIDLLAEAVQGLKLS